MGVRTGIDLGAWCEEETTFPVSQQDGEEYEWKGRTGLSNLGNVGRGRSVDSSVVATPLGKILEGKGFRDGDE